MSCTVEALVNAVEELWYYRQQKTRYECSLAIRKAKQELSEIQYSSNAMGQREYTVELQRCRRKLTDLREIINATDSEYKALFDDVLKGLEERITVLANKRKTQRPNR